MSTPHTSGRTAQGRGWKPQTVASQTCCTGGNFVQDFKRYSELPPSSDHFHRIAARSGFRDRCRTADAYAVGLQYAADPKWQIFYGTFESDTTIRSVAIRARLYLSEDLPKQKDIPLGVVRLTDGYHLNWYPLKVPFFLVRSGPK